MHGDLSTQRSQLLLHPDFGRIIIILFFLYYIRPQSERQQNVAKCSEMYGRCGVTLKGSSVFIGYLDACGESCHKINEQNSNNNKKT